MRRTVYLPVCSCLYLVALFSELLTTVYHLQVTIMPTANEALKREAYLTSTRKYTFLG